MDPLKVPPPPETKLHFLDYWRIIRIRKTVILAVFLLVVITATLVTFILPESYSSTARIKVERDQSDITFSDPTMRGMGYDPFFIQTEFETILSERVLGKVVQDLNLDEEWGKKYNNGQRFRTSDTLSMLKNQVNLQPVRNTSFLEIRVFRENPEEAKTLANAIAQAYQNYRREQRRELSMNGIQALEERV